MFHFQLIIYAGPNTNSKKVAEYGGNTFGFGSRSVLGSGWPKDLVKVYYDYGDSGVYYTVINKL
jgi:E3 ubiquitin-protein ligase HECTD4